MSFKLFIGCIPTKTNPSEFQSFLRALGDDITVPTPVKGTTINAGFVIVECFKESTYKALLSQTMTFKDRTLDIKKYQQGSDLEKHKTEAYSKRIVIENLPCQINDSDLRNYFSRFGQIEKAYALKIKHIKQADKLMGHIIFKTQAGADSALTKTSGIIKGLKISYKPFSKYSKKSNTKQIVKEISESNSDQNLDLLKKPILKQGSSHSRQGKLWIQETENQKSEGASSKLAYTFGEVQQNHNNDNLGFTARFLLSRPSAISMRFRIRTTNEGISIASPMF